MRENSGTCLSGTSGRVSLGSGEIVDGKVYITMAGYPLRRPATCKGIRQSKEVMPAAVSLCLNNTAICATPPCKIRQAHLYVSAIRLWRQYTRLCTCLTPLSPFSIQPAYGGAMAPILAFYNSYASE